jgi:lactam utilization protein B
MLINCDIGERGIAHKVDNELMSYVDIANIACSGHAGDKESVKYYKALAQKHDVKTSAHLSYPDKKNFGRVILDMPHKELLKSLDMQYDLAEGMEAVKLHGALYNQANVDTELSKVLVEWFFNNGVKEVLTQFDSALDLACQNQGIEVIHEAFLDRRYIYEDSILKLSPRTLEDAVIHDHLDAKEQFENLKKGYVIVDDTKRELVAKTLCIHSDSPSAIKILQAIQDV